MIENKDLPYLTDDLKPFAEESDCCYDIVKLRKEIERLSKEVDMWIRLYNEEYDIINELRNDLKTLWILLWNMDTEMTGYQNEVFDKYYDEFHKN